MVFSRFKSLKAFLAATLISGSLAFGQQPNNDVPPAPPIPINPIAQNNGNPIKILQRGFNPRTPPIPRPYSITPIRPRTNFSETKNYEDFSEEDEKESQIKEPFKERLDWQLEMLTASNIFMEVDNGNGYYYQFKRSIEFANDEDKFADWLLESSNEDQSNNISERNIERDKILEYMVRRSIPISINKRFTPTNRILKLTESYNNIMNRHPSNFEFLHRGVEGLERFSRSMSYTSVRGNEEIFEDYMNLYANILNRTNELQDSSNEKRLLVDQALKIPLLTKSFSKSQDDKLARVFADNYFPQSVEDNKLISQFIEVAGPKKTHSNWDTYLVSRVVTENFEYFESESIRLMEDIETSEDPLDSINRLEELVRFLKDGFNVLGPEEYAKDPSNNSLVKGESMRNKIIMSIDSIGEKSFETGISRFKKLRMEEEYSSRSRENEEKKVETKELESLRNLVEFSVNGNEENSRALYNSIEDRLKTRTDPNDREASYYMLGTINDRSIRKVIARDLRRSLSLEDSPTIMRGVGKTTASLVAQESEENSFPNRSQNLVSDLARAVEDREFAAYLYKKDSRVRPNIIKTYEMPSKIVSVRLSSDGKFEEVIGGRSIGDKIDRSNQSEDDINGMYKVQDNAFIALGYSAIHSQDKEYKLKIREFLRSKLNPEDLSYMNPNTIGEKVATVIRIYESTKESNQRYLEHNEEEMNKVVTSIFEDLENIVTLDFSKTTTNKERKLRNSFIRSMHGMSPSGKSRIYRDYLELGGVKRSDIPLLSTYAESPKSPKRTYQTPEQSP